MKRDNSVLIKKLKHLETAPARAAEVGEVEPGQYFGNISVPVDYTVEGELLEDIVVGAPISLFRRKRNGVEIAGIFQTTEIVNIVPIENGFNAMTANSVYQILVTEAPYEN